MEAVEEGCAAMTVAIGPPYGAALARNFSRRVVEGLRAGSEDRIADLYAAALADTAAELEPRLAGRAPGMALEFVLAGNGDLRLCKGR